MSEWWSAFFTGFWLGVTIPMVPSLLVLAWLLWSAPNIDSD
jgi:hypothetical protein